MPVNVADAIKELIADILGSRQSALQFAGDPHGTLAARGITEGDLSNVDVNGLAREACGGPGIPPNVQSAVQSATSGGPAAHPPAHSVEQVVQQVQQVTYVAYEGDTSVTNHIINNDNRTDIDVEGDFDGDIDIDNENTNASEGGVAGSGEGNVTGATGAGANAVGGNNTGPLNTGDGAVQAGGNIDGPTNTGINSGVLADGPVSDTVVGNDNNTANIDGPGGEPVILFGGGSVNQANHNSVTDGAVSAGGSANNVSNNDASQGGAVSGVGDSQGHHSDDDTTTTSADVTTTIDADIHDFGNTDSYNQTEVQPLETMHAEVMPEHVDDPV